MNKLLTNFPVTLTEEQKNVLKLTLSAVLQNDTTTKYWRPTVYENGDIMWALIDSESIPMSQNIKGPSGFTPRFQIDQSTAEWQVTYDGTNWTSLGIIASGAQGPQGIPGIDGTNGTDGKDGIDGKDGADGTSIILQSVTDVDGGKQVTLAWGETPSTSSFVIPNGASGAPGIAGTDGKDGYSPTVTTSEIEPTSEHPQGGTAVTITDKTGSNQFNVWNGINGEGATVNLLDGVGVHIEQDGTNYTINVSGGNIPALSAGYSWSSENATSAESTYKAFYNSKEHIIGKELEELNTFSGYVHNWSSLIKGDQGVEVLDVDGDGYPETFKLTDATYNDISSISNKLDTTAAEAAYQPKGDYATTTDIAGMATQNWVTQQGYLTQTDLNDYATETYVDTASAEALSQAKTWTNQQNFVTSAGLADNTRYEMTNTGWTSAIKIQVDSEVPTANDGILHIILES